MTDESADSQRSLSIADVEGQRVDPGWESGLVARCKGGWNVPVGQLTNELLAYISQRMALALVLAEARRRVAAGFDDGTEWYEGQLAQAVNKAGDSS